jgi:hypothetical protein
MTRAVSEFSMTKVELEEIRRRCDAATPGPWISFVEGRDHTSGSNFIKRGNGEARADDLELTGATVADQDFVAAARQDVPRLLDEVDRLTALLAARR